MLDYISLRGCRLHNLKNVDAQFPLGKITVVCGPSGCGKSTLVMDTLHGESKRRYLETLSPFAADLLGGKRTIPLDSAEGLPASLAIAATRGEAPTKASALSIAECDNALRTLFAAFAKPACPICGAPMVSQNREEIIREIAGMPIGTKLQFLAKIETGNAEMATPQQERGDINADRIDKKKAQILGKEEWEKILTDAAMTRQSIEKIETLDFITEDEENAAEEYYHMDRDLLIRILKDMENKGKCGLLKDENGSYIAVKFLR